jgi:Arc/MetJ-type ribon-helix-helix transcriptional regulator
MTTATFEEINIALPSEMITMLKSVVEAGEYSSINEIVRDALGVWKLRKNLGNIEKKKPSWEVFALEMQEFWNQLPVDNRTCDEIIGYDANGIPN